jgi:23S rRNA pseudouridine2604 synthase
MTTETPSSETLRLSKRMAELGLCSRREADEYIAKGWVTVDGHIVNVLGAKVFPHQEIVLRRAAQTQQDNRVTILLHKPIGYVSAQAEKGYHPAEVLITKENQDPQDRTRFNPRHARDLAPAGRLDIDSTGLLILTQDGRIARELIGENSDIDKEYIVRVEGALTANGLRQLNHGLSLDGKALRQAIVSWHSRNVLTFILREGKKRQIRRMCELVGLKVISLKRIRIGNVHLDNLPIGKWRYLHSDESFGKKS